MNDRRLTDSLFGGDDDESADVRPDGVGPRRDGDRPGREVRARTGGGNPPRLASRRRAGLSCLAILVVFVLLAGGGAYFLRDHLPHLGAGAPSDYSGSGTGEVTITVNRGDTGYDIGRTLQRAGVVKTAAAFVGVAGSDPDFAQIQPGTYRLRKHMSAQDAMLLMLDPKSVISHGIVVREGLWDQEIFALLSKKTGVPLADYRKVDPNTLGLPPAAHGALEGYLFPSTYSFGKGATAQQQLKTMVALGNSTRSSIGIPASRLQHVMTVASLVQAESKLGQDGPKVARVVENRLARGMPLQLDSSVHFAERKRGTLTTSDKERASSSPYNTYRVRGLPPGPIDNPGLAAIEAALHPANGSWLYFVTVNPQSGKTLFATTYAQQQANEGTFHAWCKAHPGKC